MERKRLLEYLRDTLSSAPSDVGENDIHSLAQILKTSKITSLHLAESNIGCNGVRYLAQALRYTQIHTLDLKDNDVTDEGVKYLAESLKDTQITHLNLSGNRVRIDAAKCLNQNLGKTKIKQLNLDVYCREDGHAYNYISHEVCRRKVHITLLDNKIGFEGAQYLNEMFPNIAELTLGVNLDADDVQYLARAFRGTNIGMLRMCLSHIMQENGVEYAVQAFKGSQIATLNMNGEKLPTGGAECLAKFLRQVKVLDLRLCDNQMGDEGLKYLVPVLKYSDIMYIHLAGNDLKAEGAKYLSGILRDSKIVHIDLSNNTIGADGAKYLADGLPYSQVTYIDLNGNGVGLAGYQYLLDVVENTNISWVNLHRNNIEEELDEGAEFFPNKIPRNTTSVQSKIRDLFESLVSLDPLSNKFEFVPPRNKKCFSVFDLDQYALLFSILHDNPNCKVHIFEFMCRDASGFKFDMMNKIDEFLESMQNKFNTFIDSKLPYLVGTFGGFNIVNIVKQFEDMRLSDIVQNVLLHRVLYYVDENQEILHPFIYKMLDKYDMPLYSDQLEPNKKEDIIAFFQRHQDIDYAQEIVDLLGSQCY